MKYLHSGVTVRDLERSRRFYGDLLGLKEVDRPDLGFPGAWYEIRVSYGSLRAQVALTADAFAAAGIGRGDRVAIVLPNGLPLIVCFLAAAVAGTAAPLNPGYRQEEFGFYLADTDARLLVVAPDGREEARRAAGGRIPVLTAALGATGEVQI